MGLLDKVKNMFIEEVDDDEIKKEVIQVKIPTPSEKDEEEVEHDYEPNPKYDLDYEKPTLEEVKKEEEKREREKEEKKEVKPSLPKFFDDSDFVQEPNIKPAKVFDDEVKTYSFSK